MTAPHNTPVTAPSRTYAISRLTQREWTSQCRERHQRPDGQHHLCHGMYLHRVHDWDATTTPWTHEKRNTALKRSFAGFSPQHTKPGSTRALENTKVRSPPVRV